MLQPLEQTFWSKVDKRGPNECWPWLGTKLSRARPYGVLFWNKRRVRASRVSWSLANGAPFPRDLNACHTCDNPSCVNPAHIWAGTQKENMHDMVAKNRHARMSGRSPGRAASPTCLKCGHDRSDDYVSPRGVRRCHPCKLAYDANYTPTSKRAAS